MSLKPITVLKASDEILVKFLDGSFQGCFDLTIYRGENCLVRPWLIHGDKYTAADVMTLIGELFGLLVNISKKEPRMLVGKLAPYG